MEERHTNDMQWETLVTKQHRDSIREAALEQAFSDGHQKGVAETTEKLSTEIQQAHDLNNALAEEKKTLIEGIHTQMASANLKVTASLQEACLLIIKKIVEQQVRSALSEDLTLLKQAIQDAFSHLLPNEKTTLHLSPKTYTLLKDAFSEMHVTTIEDDTLNDEDFRLVQHHTTINASLEERIDQSIASLLENNA